MKHVSAGNGDMAHPCMSPREKSVHQGFHFKNKKAKFKILLIIFVSFYY
jgi:hypothetical protein